MEAGNIVLACRGLGLGTVITTNHILYEDEVRAVLRIPADIATLIDAELTTAAELVIAVRPRSGDDLRVVTMRADVFPLPAEGGTR